ncbi:hypothetical protein FUA26_08410 [Seonamhaeicola algicola]|uniref:YceK/YidQ family lipoprotein n=1 Tax=Seonamhaeicola algicola TaxID=1719036 RepID=A0A5C7B097_9FLAO|nr:hypothetical protein [Seonamhaeicola algicola]TXE12075.1 hypothetical protein FUA26_08410 [Seonamhaeicola algicola]
MKKVAKLIVIKCLSLTFTNCATILGGPINSHQKTKPAPGQPQRDVRVVALIADIVLFLPGTIVDFATGAIYKPH